MDDGWKDFLIWTQKNLIDYKLNKLISYVATKYGHLEILQYIYKYELENNYDNSNNCEHDNEIVAIAAKYGHLEIIKWMKEIVIDFQLNVCTHAALGGRA